MDRFKYDADKDLSVLGCAADYLTFGHGSMKFGTIRYGLVYYSTPIF
jgi:hypothetical protein